MPRRTLIFACCLALLWPTIALADSGTLEYRARVVHNNRATVSYVDGTVNLDSGSFVEKVERSYSLDWQRLPGRVEQARPALPEVWRADGRTAHRYTGSLPRYDSELLRHFILGHVFHGAELLAPDQEYLSGQLIIGSATVDSDGFEIVASFRGTPLVIVGHYQEVEGRLCPSDMAVLGPASELYQYFVTDVSWKPEQPETAIALPQFDVADYVEFPKEGAQPVAIRPVKDWLIFQASLPGGRPLNLVFDSGAETMILDQWVLELDSNLQPVGELPVSGGLASGTMQLYEGFNFVVGGVEFKNLAVAGTQLTMLGFGADMRIHGIVGGDILRLCQLDLDLVGGELKLFPIDEGRTQEGEAVPLTLIQELPHVTAQVHGTGDALLLLDTGQRTSLQVNLDWLDSYELGDELMLNGFLGDVAGGLMPRYIIETLDLQLGQERYTEKTVDASLDSTFVYDGLPVVGSIGFPLLARHFGGITFDYAQKRVYLRDPGDHTFLGQPEAWEEITLPKAKPTSPWHRTDGANQTASAEPAKATESSTDGNDNRRPTLKLRSADELREDMVSGAFPAVTEDPLDLVAPVNLESVSVPELKPIPAAEPSEQEPSTEAVPDINTEAAEKVFNSVLSGTHLARLKALASTLAQMWQESAEDAPEGQEDGQPAEATEPKQPVEKGDEVDTGEESGDFSKGKPKLKFDSTYRKQ